jgi:hypothetical protein
MPAGGPEAPRLCTATGGAARGPGCETPQLAQIEQTLLEGATANGFTGELWTRVRRTPHLAYSFLRHAGLSVS